MKNVKNVRVNDGGYFKKIILFAIPVMLTHILQSLYSAADLFIIGRFEGETALAAVGCTGHLTNLILGLFMGLALGAGVSVSHVIGAKMYRELDKIVHTAILTSLVLGVLIGCVGVCFSPFFLKLMGTPENVIAQASLYMRVLFLGTPASVLYNYCASMLRASGDAKRPMYYLSIAGILNVVLNVIFVVVIPLGVAGVAIGTIASQYVSAVLVIIHMYRAKEGVRFSPRKLRIHKDKLKKILVIGIPSGIQGTLFSLANVTIQSATNSFGSTLMAGATASGNIESFVFAVDKGSYESTLTFVGQSVGARRYRDIKKIVLSGIAFILMSAAVISPLMLIFKNNLLAIYLGDNVAAMEMATPRYICMGVLGFLCAIMNVGSAVLRASGKSTHSMVICLIGACLLRIVWLNTVFLVWRTPLCIFITFPISWIITGVVLFICSAVVVKKLIKKQSVLEGGKNG